MSGKIDFSLYLTAALGHRQFLSLGSTNKAASRIHAGVKQGRVNPSTDMAQVAVLPWGCVFSMAVLAAPQQAPWPAWPTRCNSLGEIEASIYRWSKSEQQAPIHHFRSSTVMEEQVQGWSNRFHQRDKLLMLRTDVTEGEEGEKQKL